MQKICIITQFSLGIFQNEYRKFLLECPEVPNRTHMNERNQVDVSVYALPHAQNHLHILVHSNQLHI